MTTESCQHCGRTLVCGRCGTTENVIPLQWSSGDKSLICRPCLDGLEQVVGYYMDPRPDLTRVDYEIPDFPPQP